MVERIAFVYLVTHQESGKTYIGKSISPLKRWKIHQKAALRGSESSPYFYAALRKHGISQFEFFIHSEHASEDIAYQYETKLIEEFQKAKIPTYNADAGGKGSFLHPEEIRQKMINAINEAWSDPELREKQSKKLKEVWSDSVFYEHMCSIHKEYWSDITNRIKQSELLVTIWSDPELREKQSKKLKKVWSDPKLLKRHSEIQKEWSSTSEARAKNSEAQNRPEVSQKKSESVKKRWQETECREKWLQGLQSEENRQKHSEKMLARWADPSSRKKIIDGMNDPEFKQKQRERLKNDGNPRAKLTWERVRRIRLLASEGKTLSEIQALGFSDISLCTLNRVVKNRGWVE